MGGAAVVLLRVGRVRFHERAQLLAYCLGADAAVVLLDLVDLLGSPGQRLEDIEIAVVEEGANTTEVARVNLEAVDTAGQRGPGARRDVRVRAQVALDL